MKGSRDDVRREGAWLLAERGKRGDRCSGRLIANLSTVLANRQGDPITIHQQQISAIENADEDRGPAKLPPWWRYVRLLIESGQLDEAMSAVAAGRTASASDENKYSIHSPTGEIVGHIVWARRPDREE